MQTSMMTSIPDGPDQQAPPTPTGSGISLQQGSHMNGGKRFASGVQSRLHRMSSSGSGSPSKFRSSQSLHGPTTLPRQRHPRSSHSPATWLAYVAQSLEEWSLRFQMALERQLRRHGRRIAKHPVQTLLLACLIITSLFYPAAGIYLWSSKGGPGVTRGDARSVWRSLSTPLLDSFASSGRKHHNSLRDLRMIWDDAPDLRAIDARDAIVHSDTASAWHMHGSQQQVASQGVMRKACQSIRMEHVFVTTDDIIMGYGPRFGVLHVPLLQSAMKLQQGIEAFLSSDKRMEARVPPCVKDAVSPNRCLVLSPLSYWSDNKDILSSDQDPTFTVLQSKLNHTQQGIPFSTLTTLAGRSHMFQHLPRADHLALTFFLEDQDECDLQSVATRSSETNLAHAAWTSMLRNITGHQVSLLGSDWQSPKEVVLQFTPRHPEESFPTQKVLLAVAYIAMVVWLTRSLFGIKNVHSPLGLAFTACIELVISMTLAISICALSGVRLTLIPWEILPFVIVVIGSENMFALTNAIVSTPTSLSVWNRLADGFQKAGLPIAVTVLSDVLLMTCIALIVDVRAVREFCIFAIFALIVDFFMQFSFYATVLSIDMQRLDLADLLSQQRQELNSAMLAADDDSNHSDSGSVIDDSFNKDATVSRRSTSFIRTSFRTAVRARTARTASLSLLLAFLAGIYLYHSSGYTSSLSYPFTVPDNEHAAWYNGSRTSIPLSTEKEGDDESFNPYSHLETDENAASAALPWWQTSPSAGLWQMLNPDDASMIQVKIEPWVVVSLPSAARQNVGKRNFASWTIFRPRVRAIIWFFKLVILPIAGTTSLLWILLLYLLKDTELLDAKEDELDPDDTEDLPSFGRTEDIEKKRVVDALDVNLQICNNEDSADITFVTQSGPLIATLSVDGTLQIIRKSKRTPKVLSCTILAQASGVAQEPTCLAISSSFGVVAVGYTDGQIRMLSNTLQLLGSQVPDFTSASIPVSAATFIAFLPSSPTGSPKEDLAVISVHRNGSVRLHSSNGSVRVLKEGHQADGNTCIGMTVTGDSSLTSNRFAICSSDGGFEVYEALPSSPFLQRKGIARSQGGPVKSVCWIDGDPLGGITSDSRSMVVGNANGRLSVFDVATQSLIEEREIPGGPITLVRAVHSLQANGTLLVAASLTRAFIFLLGGSNPTATLVGSPLPNSLHLTLPSPRPARLSLADQYDDISTVQSGPMGPKQTRRSSYARLSSVTQQKLQQDLTGTSLFAPQNGRAEEAGMTSPSFGMTLLGDLSFRRGGLDIVGGGDGLSSTIVGVRKREACAEASNEGHSGRWEIFYLDLHQTLNKMTNFSSATTGSLEALARKSSLNLEECSNANLTGEAGFHALDARGTRAFRANAQEGLPSFLAGNLSFTRLDNVQASQRSTEVQTAGTKKTRSHIVFTYGNTLAIAGVRPGALERKQRRTRAS